MKTQIYFAALLGVVAVAYGQQVTDTLSSDSAQSTQSDTIVTTRSTTSVDSAVLADSAASRPAEGRTGMDDIVEGTRRIVNGSIRIAKSVVGEVRTSGCSNEDEEDFDDEDVEDDKEPVRHIDLAAAVHKSRKQGYGGGLGFSPAIAAVSMEPVYDLITSDPHYLANRTFPNLDDGYFVMMGSGILGYGGVGNGMRIGGYLWSGTWREMSNAYGANLDTATALSIDFGYGGLLIEKAQVFDRLNTVVGGVLAFGSYEVKLLETVRNSAFVRFSDDSLRMVKARASFTGLEMHGGFTYSFLSWMHLGADVNALIAGSMKGFDGPGNNPFFVLSPGMRLRVMFGNIG